MRFSFRRALTLILATSLAISGFTALQLFSAPAEPASAVDAHEFDPAMIISDAVFYNTGTMSASSIQTFLNSKGRSCTDGYQPCLKNYRTDTATIPADPMCKQYAGAANESAASIIYKVATACGINPEVLIVILQKEQGLVTTTQPTLGKYRAAMGAGCPDTAPCDEDKLGFFLQVYSGAWYLKRYTMPPGTGPGTDWYTNYNWYPVGGTSYVQFHPDASCGSTKVVIRNKATSSLYFYTPYQPNDAALDAGYAPSSNKCSSYGNRNFFLYFSDWFGSVRYSMPSAFAAAYEAAGGPEGPLGDARSQVIKTSNGSWMKFEGGGLYQNSQGKVSHVWGSIYTYYNGIGGITSDIGAPLNPERKLPTGGAVQNFENGNLYWKSRIGVHLIVEPVQSAWKATGWEEGPTGYPISDPIQTDRGVYQKFEVGTFYQNSDGEVFPVWGSIRTHYEELGAMTSSLGGPVGSEVKLAGGGAMQKFEEGAIYYKPLIGSHHVPASILPAWKAGGGEKGSLGYPIADPVEIDASGGGYSQAFEGGTVFTSAADGAQAMLKGAMLSEYVKRGGPDSELGWPVNGLNCKLRDGGCVESFQNGHMYITPKFGAHFVPLPVAQPWRMQGWENGALGYPVKDAVETGKNGGGVSQEFEHGAIYLSDEVGTRVMPNSPLRTAYEKQGGPAGSMGWPVNAINCTLRDGGCVESFQNGHLYLTPKLGAHFIPLEVAQPWRRQGWENGALGYPTGDATSTDANGGGVSQAFEGGSIFLSDGVGIRIMPNSALLTAYLDADGPAGGMGWPINAIKCTLRDGGCVESFQNGHLYVTPKFGAHFVPLEIAADWRTRGWENGALGYPTADPVYVSENGGGVSQEFEGGTIYSSARGGTQTMLKGPLRTGYIDRGGPAGSVGWPVNEANCTLKDGGCVESFQNGHIYWMKTTGTHLVDLRIAKLWAANGWEAGKFGYPTSDPQPYNEGVSQSFQHGSIAWTPSTGAVVLS